MKLLWLNANLLLPLDKGGKLRTWHLMRQLAKRHDITYLSFEDPDERPEHRGGMREVCRELVTVPRTDPPKGTVRFYADAARYLLDSTPYAIAKYRSPAYAARLETLRRQARLRGVLRRSRLGGRAGEHTAGRRRVRPAAAADEAERQAQSGHAQAPPAVPRTQGSQGHGVTPGRPPGRVPQGPPLASTPPHSRSHSPGESTVAAPG